MTGSVDMRDFSKKREEIWFTINGVDLRAKPALGMATVQRVAVLRDALNNATGTEKIGKLTEMFGLLLHSTSVDNFKAVMSDEDEPVDAEQLTDMLNYVVEKQGLRPTQPSSESSTSPDNGQRGIPGEGGVSPVA